MSDQLCFKNISFKNARFVFVMFFGVMLFIAAAASPAHAKQQEYMGEIAFKSSKNVQIHFYLSADEKAVEKINFKMKKLLLEPASKGSGVASTTLNDAELNDTTVYKIIDGKLLVDSFFIFDLTVIDSCIYGTIGINYETDEGVMIADPVYVVLPNITNPKEIPADILNP